MYDDLILNVSLKYKVPTDWIRGIIYQESRSNPYALRFEPLYKYLVTPEVYAKALGISIDTETQCQKMSWGLGQIMGALARELGHKGPMGELFLPEINIGFISKRLSQIQKVTASDDEVFAVYNGGIGARSRVGGKFLNQNYVDSVKHYLQTL